MGHDLVLYKSWLAEAHLIFRKASQQKVPLTYASEWVLDNYYIIRQALQQIKEDMPVSFYKQLPRLSGGPLKDIPRIYAIARSILSYQHLLLDPVDLQTILIQFQERVPLTMGELWALPTFLRYGLIEFLAHVLISTIRPSNPPDLPAELPLPPGAIEPISDGEADAGARANNDGIANIILSLRTISEQDWANFFESVSRLEQTLRKDPAGIYSRMDFKTRDLYRKEIEKLSLATGREETELAEITLDLARSSLSDQSASLQEAARLAQDSKAVSGIPHGADQSPGNQGNPYLAPPETHIGEVLLGKGRTALEQHIGYIPDLKTSVKRRVLRHASVVYLSSILLLTILIFVTLSPCIAHHNPFGIRQLSLEYCANCWKHPAAMDHRCFAAICSADPGADDCHQPGQLVDHPGYPAEHSAQVELQGGDTRPIPNPGSHPRNDHQAQRH